jgi:hypothetical protein
VEGFGLPMWAKKRLPTFCCIEQDLYEQQKMPQVRHGEMGMVVGLALV